MQESNTVRLPEKLGYMAFSTSVNIVYNFRSIYYLIFLTNVLKIPVLTAGTILTLGIIWDGINDPLIGAWCANHTFRSGEKIRPYLVWTAVPWGLFTILLFTNFQVALNWDIAIAIVIYFLYEVLSTFKDVPYTTMAVFSSPSDADRKSINSFRSLGGCIGSGIGAVAVTPLVKLFGGLQGEDAIIGEGDARALILTAITMAAICIFGAMLHYFTTKERVKVEEEPEDKLNFIEAYKLLFKCKSWVKNMLFITLYGVSNTLIMTCISYYAAYVLNSSSSATPILAVYLVVSIIISIVAPYIDNMFGRRKATILAILVLIVGKIPFILFPKSLACMYINAATMGIGATMSYVILNTNRNNVSDIVAVQNGRRFDAMVSSGDSFANKFGNALVTWLISFSLSKAGFDESLLTNQTEATINTICAMVGWVPMIIAVITLLVVFNLDTEKEMQESLKMKEEI